MSRTDSLRGELARLTKKEADVQKDVAKHSHDANKHAADASKKFESARKTKNLSSRNSYIRQADASAARSAASEKKVAAAGKQLADVAKAKASKQEGLEAAEKSERDAVARQASRDRRAEEAHVRKIATLRNGMAAIPAPKPEPLRVLYLTTNPEMLSGEALRTDAEVRNVQNELRGTRYRDSVVVSHLPAATFEDMLNGMNDIRPHVVHFSGHGGGSGVLFDNGDVARPTGVGVGYRQLTKFLEATDEPPRLLVLNACDTLNGADEVLSAVPVVVAMSDKITDTAAVVFATKFYSAIAGAQSIGSAIKQARAMLSMLASAEDHLPEYVSRDGIDVDALVLVTPE
ncbi:CHAT domain-containing protein [Ochrobactrum sp. Sa2BUA5]|nr:CHAT domain-containing protein [Ochrobactrum gallinarum]